MKLNNKDIDSIIFDLGGVLLNLDYQLTINAFETLGMADASKLFSQKSQSNFFDQFEVGEISSHQFREEVRLLMDANVTDNQIDEAWNAMLLDFPVVRFEVLKTLAPKKRIFLLSNTNIIHMGWFKRYVNQLFGEGAFFELFEVAYLSNELGMRKPNVEIFEHVIRENNLNPYKTLFIDDSAQHLEGAKKAGLQTHWLKKDEKITDLLSRYL